MTPPWRFISERHSSSDPKSNYKSPDSDFVLILAALLCALICVLGLIAVVRCACFRRSPPPPPRANKGIKKKTLRSLPKLIITPESAVTYTDCAICLSDLTGGDEIQVLPQCGHGFHVSCINRWLESHSSCPSCRQILAVTRCHKCGGFQGNSSTPAESEVRMDGVNRFLP